MTAVITKISISLAVNSEKKKLNPVHKNPGSKYPHNLINNGGPRGILPK
jgi:hypothetical protein